MSNEKFMKSVWKYVRSWVRDLDSYGTDQFIVAIFFSDKDARWCDNPYQGWLKDVGKEDAVWEAAAEFTRDRLEEIRQRVNQYIQLGADNVHTWVKLAAFTARGQENIAAELGTAWVRRAMVMALIEEKLEGLKKGIKPEALK